MNDWTKFRAQFPAVRDYVYLNTAGGGVTSLAAAASGAKYYEEAAQKGDTNWDVWIERVERDRRDLALMIGAEASRLSFLQNASLALNIVAQVVGSDAIVLALDKEFASCTTPFLRNGSKVHFVRSPESGYIDPEVLKSYLHLKPTVLVVSSVQFATGFRLDLAQLGGFCRDHNILFVVDATQSIGAFPIDMIGDSIDVLVFSGYKWATAGYGIAVLATSDSWPEVDPPLVGWRSARNAYALENDRLDLLQSGIGHEMGHPLFSGIFALGEAMRLLDRQGGEEVSKRIIGLIQQLRAGLQYRGLSVRSHEYPAYASGILVADVAGADGLCSGLRSRNVWTSVRDGGLRISTHAYNNEDDIHEFFTALDGLHGQKVGEPKLSGNRDER